MTTQCYCDMCGVATTALENRCDACGADLPAFEIPVRTDPFRAIASAMEPTLKYWPFVAGVTLLLLVMAIVPTRPWQARDWPIALFFASPFILGLIVALMHPAAALTAATQWEAWIARRREAARAKDSAFSKWALRPVLWTFAGATTLSERIEDEHVRVGMKLTTSIYIIGAVLYIAFVVTVIVITLVLIVLALAIFAHFTQADTEPRGRRVGSSDGSSRRDTESGSDSRTSIPVGRRGSSIISGTNFFNEQTTGRIDEDGNIYQGTNFLNEEKVGRMDEEGNVYMGKSWFTENKVGRLDEEGNVHEGTNFLNETKVGRVDADGNVYEGSNFLTEKRTGRIEKKE